MKISEMTNEQAADVLVRISAPVANICDDDKITEMLKKYQALEEMPLAKAIAKFLPEIMGSLFKEHKEDVFEIVGALTGKTRAQAAKMRFIETLKVVQEAANDEDLVGFFTSLKVQKSKTGEESVQD